MRAFVISGCPGSYCFPTYTEVLLEVCLGISAVCMWVAWLSGSEHFQPLRGLQTSAVVNKTLMKWMCWSLWCVWMWNLRISAKQIFLVSRVLTVCQLRLAAVQGTFWIHFSPESSHSRSPTAVQVRTYLTLPSGSRVRDVLLKAKGAFPILEAFLFYILVDLFHL